MSLHPVLIAVGALLPTAGVAFLFYLVIKAMLEGDRNERLAHSRWEAGLDNSASSTDKSSNVDPRDSVT